MAEEIENLQLKAEELLYKHGEEKLLAVTEHLEVAVEGWAGKGEIIKEIRKRLDRVVEGTEKADDGKISFLKTLISHLDESTVPPLEENETAESEVAMLEKAYSELEKKFEEEKTEIVSKLNTMKTGSKLPRRLPTWPRSRTPKKWNRNLNLT